jgi:K+-sensing histidine kinase KdpD
MPTEELFRRFKKENPDSIGLGLSIVKQICELHFFEITYKYIDYRHAFVCMFQKCQNSKRS